MEEGSDESEQEPADTGQSEVLVMRVNDRNEVMLTPAPRVLYMNNFDTLRLEAQAVYDLTGAAVPNLMLTVLYSLTPVGHEHPVGTVNHRGTLQGLASTSAGCEAGIGCGVCNTGWDGHRCQLILRSRDVATKFNLRVYTTSFVVGAHTVSSVVYSGRLGGQQLSWNMEMYGPDLAYLFKPPTTTHPDSHWCQRDFCDKLRLLTAEYLTSGGSSYFLSTICL